jgi:hypothetical protein
MAQKTNMAAEIQNGGKWTFFTQNLEIDAINKFSILVRKYTMVFDSKMTPKNEKVLVLYKNKELLSRCYKNSKMHETFISNISSILK